MISKIAQSLLIIFALNSMLYSQTIPESTRSRKAKQAYESILIDEYSKKGLTYGNPIFIRIFKENKTLEIWVQKGEHFKLFKEYEICTYGKGGLGPKLKEGDRMAPEGFYFVKPNQLNPWSDFHLAFNIGYPNKYDRTHKHTGSAIMVHGNCVSVGCFAMTDDVIDEIYTIISKSFEDGQPYFRIHIFPFMMTDENIVQYKDSENYEFWNNLKVGYDYFEENKQPPNVEVIDKVYVFN